MLQKDPTKKYDVKFLQHVLQNKMKQFIEALKMVQKQGFDLEEGIFSELSSVFNEFNLDEENQKAVLLLKDSQSMLNESQKNHEEIQSERHQERRQIEKQLKDLEGTLIFLKQQVESTSAENEKLKVEREERLAMDIKAQNPSS